MKELAWGKGVQRNKSEKVIITGWLLVLFLHSAAINISLLGRFSVGCSTSKVLIKSQLSRMQLLQPSDTRCSKLSILLSMKGPIQRQDERSAYRLLTLAAPKLPASQHQARHPRLPWTAWPVHAFILVHKKISVSVWACVCVFAHAAACGQPQRWSAWRLRVTGRSCSVIDATGCRRRPEEAELRVFRIGPRPVTDDRVKHGCKFKTPEPGAQILQGHHGLLLFSAVWSLIEACHGAPLHRDSLRSAFMSLMESWRASVTVKVSPGSAPLALASYEGSGSRIAHWFLCLADH